MNEPRTMSGQEKAFLRHLRRAISDQDAAALASAVDNFSAYCFEKASPELGYHSLAFVEDLHALRARVAPAPNRRTG